MTTGRGSVIAQVGSQGSPYPEVPRDEMCCGMLWSYPIDMILSYIIHDNQHDHYYFWILSVFIINMMLSIFNMVLFSSHLFDSWVLTLRSSDKRWEYCKWSPSLHEAHWFMINLMINANVMFTYIGSRHRWLFHQSMPYIAGRKW
jgi:hypothetical protein